MIQIILGKQQKFILLSNYTVVRRIDSNKDCHLIASIRFCDDLSTVKELLFYKPIENKAPASELPKVLDVILNKTSIPCVNGVGICRNDVGAMFGRFESLQEHDMHTSRV